MRGAPLMVARAQIVLGWAQRFAGKFTASVQTLESAKTTFAGHGDIGGAAQADIEVGHTHFYMGNYGAARSRFEPARATCAKIGWRSCEALALNSLGVIDWVDGRYSASIGLFNEGVAIARETADKQTELATRSNIAEIHVYMGRSEEAWRESQSLLAEVKAGNSAGLEPAALVTAGLARLQQGRVDEGRSYLDAALASSRRLDDRRYEAYTLTKIAVVHFFEGSVDKAAADLERAVALRRQLGEKSPEAEAASRLAAVRIAQGRLDDAEAILPAARKVLADEHALIDWVYATSVTAELLLARGKAAEALFPMREIRQKVPTIEKPSLRIRVNVTEARVLAATGERNKALSMLGAAIAEADRLDLPMESLGAALTLGELQLADPATKARGVSTVERARTRARALGMKYFDHKAEQLLAGAAL
jgi:tetratricopeptide (TPR) repeat protein